MNEFELIELKHTLQNFSFAWQWAQYFNMLRNQDKFHKEENK